MAIIRPIPRKLLIHEVEYREYLGSGRNGETWAEDKDMISLKHVRIEPSSEVKRTAYGDERQLHGILFIDHRNSNPNIKPKEKSKVYFNGQEHFVNKVDVIYGLGNTPHHYEVELI
ncbi:putative minor capsid protein [Evansella tamaricis]|uniref:Minor capsid protein n=1 Tax=Evansella tamaricis TaxID=2069301 RepID=A0ABS6JF28_9BACI|nr:putative minor capsid protein [Evansella tamaricis]MBU9711065.1 minor capsid protein [Evansella tamaricis]